MGLFLASLSAAFSHWHLVGVADFYGTGTDDILYRNNATGDTWFEGISDGAMTGWHQIGSSDTAYSVVGTATAPMTSSTVTMSAAIPGFRPSAAVCGHRLASNRRLEPELLRGRRGRLLRQRH
jgi:hypothetical protein